METEAALQSEEIGVALERSPYPMWIYDLKTLAFLKVNQPAIDGYGFSEKEFLSMTVLDIRPGADITRFLESWKHPHESTAEKWWHVRRDGTIFPVSITSWSLTFEGHEAELVLARRDIGVANPIEFRG